VDNGGGRRSKAGWLLQGKIINGSECMTVLVTGGAGFIGSHMVWELLDNGHTPVVIDNLTTGFRWAVPPQVTLITGDVGDGDLVRTVMRKHAITAVIHFAGSIVVPESVADPLGYYNNNTVKSRALIEAAVQCGVKHFIFSSTAAVYGNPAASPVAETAVPAPMSPYGSSKLMTEIMLADAARAHDLHYCALRYFNVAGADPKGRTGQSTAGATHLIKVACETALGQRSHIDVFGTDYPTPDGTCIRDYIHVSDLAAAHTSALTYLRAGGKSDIFNVGYSKGYSVLEVVDAVKRVSGRTFDVRMAPRRPGDPASIVAASAKIRDTLDWTPRNDDLDAIVRQALAWEDHLARFRKSA
jgi:UDP-glucose 4-epimerase